MRAGSRPPLPAHRVRRRTAGFTALGSTCAAFIALVATGIAASQPDRSGLADREAVLSPATRAVGSRTVVAPSERYARVVWRNARSVGRPNAGTLVNGTKLPAEGQHFVTWDPKRHRTLSPMWRRYATDGLIRVLLRVADDFARAHPDAPRLTIGDLSRRRGGRFGGNLHASHQNGLDADIYYPRRDRRERAPLSVRAIEMRLAQDLVDRFVRAGAEYVFVGPRTPLTGPRGVVQPLRHHDNHLHVRLRAG